MKNKRFHNRTLLSYFNKLVESGKYLFHGSPISGLTEINTHDSCSYPELGKIVFLTPDPSFAACFLFTWRDNVLKQGVDIIDNKVKVSL